MSPANRDSREGVRSTATWLLTVAALVAAATLAACGGDDSDDGSNGAAAGTTETTQEEVSGDVVFMNIPDFTYEGEYDKFERQFGASIKEEPADYTAGVAAVANQVITSPDEFDIAILDPSQMPRLEANDLLVPQDESTVPNMELIEPQSVVDQAVGGVPLDISKVGIAYRKDLIDEEPTSWADFWELAPQHSGEVVFLNDERSAMGAVLRYLGYSANTQDEGEIEEAKQKILEIRDDLLGFRTFDILKPLVNGDAVMAMTYDYEVPLADDPRIGWVFPEEGTAGFIDDAAVIAGGNVDAAEAFLNWRLEPRNYAKYINAAFSAPLVPDALPYIDDGIKNSPALEFDDETLQQVEFTADVGDALPVYTRAWEEVRAGG